MKKTIVISLGGSLIMPEKMDFPFLEKFKKALRKHYKTCKFVIICGGGTIARKYMYVLEKGGRSKKELSLAGIRATRENARIMMQFIGKEANDSLPLNMQAIKNNLSKNAVVFCGALRFTKNSTSDTTAAKIAHFFNTSFINLTNVNGLYTADPKKNKNAKFIPKISWKDFESIALKIKHKPGQHFVLDQQAAVIIKKHKIPTYIIGKNLSNLEKILKNKSFQGTLIKG